MRHEAFEELSIELKSLTFLLGPNNSGKSSILAVLRILHQTRASYGVLSEKTCLEVKF